MTFRICDQTKMIIPSQGKKNQPQMKPFNGAVDGSKNISALKKKNTDVQILIFRMLLNVVNCFNATSAV